MLSTVMAISIKSDGHINTLTVGKVMIFGMIEERPEGFDGFNKVIVAEIRRWLLETAHGIYKRNKSRAAEVPLMRSEVKKLLMGLGKLTRQIASDLQQALVYYQECAEMQAADGDAAHEIALTQAFCKSPFFTHLTSLSVLSCHLLTGELQPCKCLHA